MGSNSANGNANDERRNAPRKPYRGTVEVGDGEASAHEADAVDLSLGGMSLKTSYLADVGSEVACRFDVPGGAELSATGEVMWASELGDGTDAGAMGLRFTKLSPQGRKMLQRALASEAGVDDSRGKNQANATPASTDDRARMFLPGMDSPLRTKVRNASPHALVLGSDLSFLKLGEHVQVERDGRKRDGVMEDIGIEVDPTTRTARLVLTVALARTPGSTAEAPSSHVIAHDHAPRTTVTPPPPAPRTAERTAVLAPELAMAPAVERSWHDAPAGTAHAANSAHDAYTDEENDALASIGETGAPPAWLVALMARARSGSRTAIARLAAIARTSAGTISEQVDKGRARLSGAPAEPSRASQPSRRPQHIAGAGDDTNVATVDTARLARRASLGVMGAGGIVAIGYAMFSGGHAAPVTPPRPQVAVTANTVDNSTPNALAEPSATAPVAAPIEPSSAPLDPSAVGYAPSGPVAPAAAAAPHAMPSDLVAAARTGEPFAPVAPAPVPARAMQPTAVHPLFAHPAIAPARAARTVAPTAARVLGSPTVRTGTALHLRMDGPIATGITGGAASGNTLVVHVPGRRSIDMAAPLVRQDPRLAGASVYNRASGAELTLRFRDTVPGFSARAQGSTLEIVLAAPPVANAHAPSVAHRRR